ncbi:hypothetical protein CRENBAI_019407 [Crenichthys baileyi]|uniref:Uncharacterized protein n=1 Tax=Crenichthys baileyi TaxID=28760 RepID=A0AAV9SAD7_9TELE
MVTTSQQLHVAEQECKCGPVICNNVCLQCCIRSLRPETWREKSPTSQSSRVLKMHGGYPPSQPEAAHIWAATKGHGGGNPSRLNRTNEGRSGVTLETESIKRSGERRELSILSISAGKQPDLL